MRDDSVSLMNDVWLLVLRLSRTLSSLLSYPCGQLAAGSWAPHLKLEPGLFSAWRPFPEGRFRGSKLMDRHRKLVSEDGMM